MANQFERMNYGPEGSFLLDLTLRGTTTQRRFTSEQKTLLIQARYIKPFRLTILATSRS